MKAKTTLDKVGLSLSALCVIHCLLLPVIGASLPIIGAWSEIEWVHKLLVVLALPVALSVIISNSAATYIRALAGAGIVLLFTAAFWEPLHDHETLLTVIGAILLGAAHMIRFAKLRHSH